MNRPADVRTRLAPPWSTLALVSVSVSVSVLMAGCSSMRSDGPPSNPPPDLARVPDADPKLEPIRIGGPNKPYEVLGKLYTPIREDKPFNEKGLASWYGRKFQGKRTASGEPYDLYAMTAAHPTMPIPSYARVRNPANGREVVVRINDRGPFHSTRIIDLSYTAALKLDVLRGVAPVEVTRITFEDIRTGAWRRPGSVVDESVAVAVASTVAGGDAAVVKIEPPLAVAPVAAVAAASAASPASAPSNADAIAPPAPAAIAVADAASAAVPASAAATSAAPAGGFWVQLGAFRQQAGADAFFRRVAADLSWLAPVLKVAPDGGLYRLQAGPYADRGQAQDVSQRVRDSLRLVPVIVDRR